MKYPAILLVAFYTLSIHTFAQDTSEAEQKESGYYIFRGSEILVRHKKLALPIASADKKGVYLTKGNGTKKVRWSSACMATPLLTVSNKFIDLSDLQYEFVYQKASDSEELAYEAMREKERQTNYDIIKVYEGSSDTKLQDIAELEFEREEFEADTETNIRNGDLLAEGFADSIQLSMTLTSLFDIKDAYAAVMVDYAKLDGERRVAVKLHRIGDLFQESPDKISISTYLGEGDYRSSRIEIFLFEGNATPLPTSLSSSLRMLSVAELKALAETN